MPKFRKLRSPEHQARAAVGRLVNLGILRRNPNAPASVGTVRNVRQCLTQVARHIAGDGLELLDLTPAKANAYLRSRAADLGQKALDGHRQALQKLLIHVRGSLPDDGKLTIVRSLKPFRKRGRAYAPHQVPMVAARQTAPNALATLIAHAAGLRAHELLTLARPAERPPDVRPARPEKFDGRPGTDYTVVGKGGLVRLVRIPDDLAERLEERRLDQPARLTDRGIRYLSRYDVGGGEAWSRSFSRASHSALGWSRGAHGVRPGAHGQTAAAPRLRRRAGSRQPGARPLQAADHRGIPEVSRRLTLHLTARHNAALDRILGSDDSHDNNRRRRAVEQLILDGARELGDRAGAQNAAIVESTGVTDASAAARIDKDSTVRLIDRLKASRDRYRDLAVRAEAALLGVPVRDDYGNIERRLERALRAKGFRMPATSDPRRRAGSRRSGGR